jgi:6-phosphogluconolactonase (cycloisomerase 2 family)
VAARGGEALMMRTLLLAVLAAAIAAPAAAAATVSWRSPGGLAVSPDGHNVYATGERTVTFARDPGTGLLTQIDATAPYGRNAAVTADGRWVYVASGDNWVGPGGINILARDPATGLLTHVKTYTGAPGTPALAGITGIALSPDGAELYISHLRDNAVMAFRRDPSTGDLTFLQALYEGPSDLPHLGYPSDLAMSSDGRSLYVAGGQYLSAFSRDAGTGRLAPVDAYYTPSGGSHVAISPDGRRVYWGEADYTVLDRDATSGALTEVATTFFRGNCENCYIGGPLWVAPDSGSVFSSQLPQQRLFQATATPGGATFAHAYSDGSDGVDGLTTPTGAAWSTDGRFLYLAAGNFESASVLTFAWDGSRLHQVGRADPTVERSYGYPPGVSPGLSIAGGAIYVNDPQVTLTVVPPMWGPSSLRISNDPGFDAAAPRRLTPDGRYSWRLDTGATRDRSVKHVYVHFTDTTYQPGETFSDDVILDQIAPEVVSAKVRRARLLVHAKDNRSGVRKLQLASNLKHPQRARAFARTVKLQHVPKRLWVRVLDGAGNKSSWRSAKR